MVSLSVNTDWIQKALDEDIQDGDKTTQALIDKETRGRGVFLAKEDLVVCGTDLASAFFLHKDPKATMEWKVQDGQSVKAYTPLGFIESQISTLLTVERTALNVFQHLSGISTLTHQYSSKVKDYDTKILDTRKTLPHYRLLEKYAVVCGGGVNHRISLSDQMMVKDNHIQACGGDVAMAVQKAKKAYPDTFLVVEIEKMDQIEPAIYAKADRLLLDNMNHDEIKTCLELIDHRITVEISGNITLDRLVGLAKLGVDYISVGAITHSARAVDISFKIESL